MRKIYIFGLAVLVTLISSLSFADEFTMSTYYPAPFGVYNQMVARTLGVGDNNNDGSINHLDAPDPNNNDQKNDLWVAGSVGIGTTEPSYPLDVDGRIRINHGDSLLLTNPTAENHIYLRNTGVGPQRSLSVHYTSTGAPVFFIDPYSRIGIGTTTPGAQLEISAGNKNIKLLSFSEDDIQFKSFYVKSLFDPAFSGPRNRIVFSRDFAGFPDLDIFTLQDDGNIGIGTTAPQAKLEVSGDGDSILFPRKLASGDPADGVDGMIYYNDVDEQFRAHKNGAWGALGGSDTALFAEEGYTILPSGLIIQWGGESGYSQLGTDKLVTVNFPIPFPNAVLTVIPSFLHQAGTDLDAAISARVINNSQVELQIDEWAGTSNVLKGVYIAIGY